MAGTGVGKFSSTGSNNTSNMTVNFAENMAPSNVNNAARELMGHMRDMYEQLGDGYFEFGDGDGTYTVARSDADTITITSSSDISGVYFAGRKIRITDGGANVVEGTIASSSHSSTTQTVNLTGISLASGTPTKVELGIDTAAFGGRVILDDDGDTYIEASTDDNIEFFTAGKKQFNLTNSGSIQAFRDGGTTFGPSFNGQHQRGTLASPSIVQSGDRLVEFKSTAYDGTAYIDGPRISFRVDGTPGDDDMPSRIEFQVVADGSNSLNEVMRIDSAGIDVTGAITATAASTITTADNTTQLTLKSTDADGGAGPKLTLQRDSGSPADGDVGGRIHFVADDDAGNTFEAALIDVTLDDVSNGSEDATLDIKGVVAGSEVKKVSFGAETVFNEDSADLDFRVESNNDTHMLFVDAGNDHVNIKASADLGGVLNVSGSTVILVNDNEDTLTLKSTDADANSGPILVLNRDSGSPADNDACGLIKFKADDDGGNSTELVNISAKFTDVSNGAEDATFNISSVVGGSQMGRFAATASETVLNDDSGDIDFRVESNGNDYMLFVDGGLNEVMVGGNAEQSACFSVQQSVAGDQGQVITCTNTSYTGVGLDIGVSRNTTNSTYFFLKCQRRGFANSFLVSDGGDVLSGSNTFGAISDLRVKSDIVDASSQWDDIKAIKVRNFKKFDMPDLLQIGVVAQELEDAGMTGLIRTQDPSKYDIAHNSVFGTLYEDGDTIPEESKIGDVKEVKEQVKSVKYSVLYMKAIKALQEAMDRIETLETKVEALES